MALPSQSARQVSARSPMDMAKRKLAPIAIGAAGIGLVVTASWLIFGRGAGTPESALASANVSSDSPSNALPAKSLPVESTTPSSAGLVGSSAANPSAASDANLNVPHQDPPVIQMGSSTPVPSSGSMAAPNQNLQAHSNVPAAETRAPNTPASTGTGANAPAAAPSTGIGGTNSGAASVARINSRMQTGLDLIAQNKPVEARDTLSSALAAPGLNAADAERIRIELTKLNDRLVFGTEIVPGDPFVSTYVIQSGDSLSRLPKTQNLQIDWRLIQRVNRISSPERIQVGQHIKLIKGPFHVVVHKNDFRMDVYEGNGSQKVFIRSFNVGLGEYNSTPVGLFIVRPGKMVNPDWRNPRTGEKFSKDDPKNPLGERWIPLQGMSDSLKDISGYGIHGTIEPDSIGKQSSMGCVRMLPADVEVVYELLTEGISTVEIRED
ncbi:MAG TPA: L,D-transpeptidase family protein [Phycisphaerales bacterium]|nr:L,D-transpeptidase family protein [Phycisphaerales bacterium]